MRIYIRENQVNMLKENETSELNLFHGSTSDFDSFDLSHAGSGEGTEAYGFGVYVTTVEDTAHYYAKVSQRNNDYIITFNGHSPSNSCERLIANYLYEADFNLIQTVCNLRELQQIYKYDDEVEPQKIEDVNRAIEIVLGKYNHQDETLQYKKPSRIIYEVEIPEDNGDNYINWRNVDQVQLHHIAKLCGLNGNYEEFSDLYNDLTKKEGSTRNASAFLKRIGYDGTKVQTQLKDGWNYTIFDQNDVRIIKKTKLDENKLVNEVIGDDDNYYSVSQIQHNGFCLLWQEAEVAQPFFGFADGDVVMKECGSTHSDYPRLYHHKDLIMVGRVWAIDNDIIVCYYLIGNGLVNYGMPQKSMIITCIKKALAQTELVGLNKYYVNCNVTNVPTRINENEEEHPEEMDVYTIGGGEYKHMVQEGFNYELNQIGSVEPSLDFDEDYYQEWLEDNELEDSQENKLEFIKTECEFDLDYTDSEYYHHMDYDSMYYDDMVDAFGERMANDMLNACLNGESKYFEPLEYANDEEVDSNDINAIEEDALRKLKHGSYFKNVRGFVLHNGEIVYTDAEHNMITRVVGIDTKFDAVRKGMIRLLPNAIDIGDLPTYEQEKVLAQLVKAHQGEELYMDIFDNSLEHGCRYFSPSVEKVIMDIRNFYNNGVVPNGNSDAMYESVDTTNVFPSSKVRNSDGFMLGTETNEDTSVIYSDAFKSWFGDWENDPKNSSIVVGEDGRPLVCYHSSENEFSEFDPERINSGGAGAYHGYGFNFTTYHNSTYGKHVYETFLYARKPISSLTKKFTINKIMKIMFALDKGETDSMACEFTGDYTKINGVGYWDNVAKAAKQLYDYADDDLTVYSNICMASTCSIQKVISLFQKMGYDSAIEYGENNIPKVVVVFSNKQIKSIKSNNFSKENPSIFENVEYEVAPKEVETDSFELKNDLEDTLWKGNVLDSSVRLQLLDIADDFIDFLNIKWVKPKDIILTGSICNFNWSEYSDIDLHIIIDFNEVSEKTELVREYFDTKKNAWNDEHEHLTIYGYNIELYVQDITEEAKSEGVYSLEKNKWLRKPNKDSFENLSETSEAKVKILAASIMTYIDSISEKMTSTNDNYKLEKIGEKVDKLTHDVKQLRGDSLNSYGEMGVGNIVYKSLRRSGYLDKMWSLKNKVYDKINSI